MYRIGSTHKLKVQKFIFLCPQIQALWSTKDVPGCAESQVWRHETNYNKAMRRTSPSRYIEQAHNIGTQKKEVYAELCRPWASRPSQPGCAGEKARRQGGCCGAPSSPSPQSAVRRQGTTWAPPGPFERYLIPQAAPYMPQLPWEPFSVFLTFSL